MDAHRPHPMMPESNHDEIAEQLAIVDMKAFMFSKVDPGVRKLLEKKVAPEFKKREGRDPRNHQELRKDMEKEPGYQAWLNMNAVAQDMMWDAVGTCVDRQIDELVALVGSDPDGDAACPYAVVCGPPSTGKSTVVGGVLRALRRRHAWVPLLSCETDEQVFRSILLQLAPANPTDQLAQALVSCR